MKHSIAALGAGLGLLAALGLAPAALAQTAAPSQQGTLGTPTNPGGGGSTMTQGTTGQTGTPPGSMAEPPAVPPMPPTVGAAPAIAPVTGTAPAEAPPARAAAGSGGTAAPVAGANSFTEGQARSRISDAGFQDVGPLQLDSDGVWRGRGVRGGTQMDVAMDYQGNVTAGGQPIR